MIACRFPQPGPASLRRLLSVDPVDYDQMTDLKGLIAFVAGSFQGPIEFCSLRTGRRGLEITLSRDGVTPGEAYLADTPVLQSQRGTQPDLFLRWNTIPVVAASVDVVVHLHGFSQQGGAMPLAEKVAGSGLDLSGRKRPTIALLPRGNWLKYTRMIFRPCSTVELIGWWTTV